MNRRCIILILVAVPLFAFIPALFGEFLLLDDELLILDNPKVHGLDFQNIISVFTTYDPELYIPFTLLTHQIEYALFGAIPFPYHLTNLLLHIGSTILVFLIFERWFSSKISFGLALLFAVHPIQSEAVSWASARKDVLSAFFTLFSFHLYFLKRNRLSLLTFVIAGLSKVNAVMLPFVIFIISGKKSLQKLFPYFCVSFIFVIIAFGGKQSQINDLWTPVALSFPASVLTLRHIVFPFGFSVFYPFTNEVTVSDPLIFWGMIFFVVVTGLAIYLRRKCNACIVSWFIFLILLSPSFLNVSKGGDGGITDLYITSDRYAYLAILGPIYLLGTLVREKFWWILCLVAAVLTLLTFRQSFVWQTSEALFRNVTDYYDDSYVAYNNLAGVLAKNNRFDEAVSLYEKSLSTQENWRAFMNIAQIHAARGQYEKAIRRYEELLVIRPDNAYALAQVGGLYLRYGDVERAYTHLDRSRQLDPNIASVHYNLGLIFENIGAYAKANASFEKVLAIDPDDVQAQDKITSLRSR